MGWARRLRSTTSSAKVGRRASSRLPCLVVTSDPSGFPISSSCAIAPLCSERLAPEASRTRYRRPARSWRKTSSPASSTSPLAEGFAGADEGVPVGVPQPALAPLGPELVPGLALGAAHDL